MKKTLGLAAVIAGMSAMAVATPLSPCGPAIGEITSTTQCTVGPDTITFSNVSLLGVSTLGFDAATSFNTTTDDVNLVFQFAPSADDWDIHLNYTITGYIDGVDGAIRGAAVEDPNDVNEPETDTPSARITEIYCIPNTTECGTQVTTANAGNGYNGSTSLAFPEGLFVGALSIDKDISATDFSASGFTDSYMVPEPMTFSLMGAGLLGLGLIRRKARK